VGAHVGAPHLPLRRPMREPQTSGGDADRALLRPCRASGQVPDGVELVAPVDNGARCRRVTWFVGHARV
jgi:hypothetical protein